MTMGPEIFAWIGEAGLIRGAPEKKGLVGAGQKGQDGSAGSGAASLRGHFDLDLHLGLVEASYHEQRCPPAGVAQDVGADRGMGVGGCSRRSFQKASRWK